MAKQKTAKQKENIIDKTEEIASNVKSPEKVDGPVDESIDEPVDESVDEKVEEPVDEKVDEPVEQFMASSETLDKAKQGKKKAKWHFPNASQCPRCKTFDTVATSTKGNKQYRACQRGICRYRYCEIGVREK